MIRFTRLRLWRVVAAVVLPAALVLGTYGTASAGEAKPKAANSAKKVDREAEFRFVHNTGYSTLDPHKATTQASMYTLEPVYDSLLAFDSNAKGETILVPRLAKSWKTSNDGLKLTFDLRDDVVFQDGTPFTAAAVKANIERAKANPAVASLLASVTSVDAPNPRTAVFNLSQPDASVLLALAFDRAGLMVSPTAFNNPDLSTKPVGSGPYKVTSATPGAQVVYERWDDSWAAKQQGLVKKITYTIAPDTNARYNGMRSGQYDGAYLAAPTDVQSTELVPQGYHRLPALAPVSTGVLLNGAKAPFDNVKVRQAVNLALNRKAISQATTNGLWLPTYEVFQEGFVGYDPALDKDPYNAKKAKKIIEQEGATGAEVSILQVNNAPSNLIGETVQQALNDIGLKATLKPVTPAEVRTVWKRGADNAAVVSIQGHLDPGATLSLSYLAGSDNLAAPPAELVKMAADAKALPVGSQERENAYKKINRYLSEQMIHVPMLQIQTIYMTRPNVVGSENLVTTGAPLSFRGVGLAKSK